MYGNYSITGNISDMSRGTKNLKTVLLKQIKIQQNVHSHVERSST